MNDTNFLRQALELARAGVGLASPNPCVGAVIVDPRGAVIGTGTHTYDGVKHAEILALEQAGSKARGGTLYINLEPCSHQGRTAPCADAVIAAGISRVVACMEDPNPLVKGRGFARLREAGVRVDVGGFEQEARRLNEAFARYSRTGKPLVTLKAAMTLDGKIAPPPGESETPTALGSGSTTGGWITSEAARAHVHELRHESDAILVGVGTIIADDPFLTDRSGKPRRRQLLRVILDSRLRIPLESRAVQTVHNDLLVVCSFPDDAKRKQLESRGARVLEVTRPSGDDRPNLPRIMEELGKQEITSVMIEGGAMVNGAALAAGIADKVFLYYAPKILAGIGSIPFAAGPGFRRLSEAAYVRGLTLHRFGEDFAVEGYLRDPHSD
jgi:diaminohydroxyphosphoribosylaminopyrimidine deaminase / 5-amino-6-(5-phosphoribosylamino)uracil reductase